MKFDFDDPSQTKLYELEDGEFGTEPVFVENPEGNGEVEDNGWVVVQTLNGRKNKATIVILNATTMEVEFKAKNLILDRIPWFSFYHFLIHTTPLNLLFLYCLEMICYCVISTWYQ